MRYPAYDEVRRRARAWLIQLEGMTLPHGHAAGHSDRARLELDRLAVGRRHAFLARADGTGDPGALPRGNGPIIRESRTGSSSFWTARSRAAAGTTATRPSSATSCDLSRARRAWRSWPWPPGGDRSRQAEPPSITSAAVFPACGPAVSLGWGVLGLRAHGACPPEAGGLAGRVLRTVRRQGGCRLELALLLLAASDRSLVYLFEPSRRERSPSDTDPDSWTPFLTRIA